MNPKSNRKLNQKIQSFFQKRKAVSISPQAILSKSDFDRNKLRMFWHQHKAATLNYLRVNLKKITYRFSRPGRMEAKLKRMRAKALREEARISNSQYPVSPLRQVEDEASNIQQKSKYQISKFLNMGLFKSWSFIRNLPAGRQGWKLGIRNLKNRVFLKKAFAAITILAVLVTAYFQNTPHTFSATNYWVQTDWSGGAI